MTKKPARILSIILMAAGILTAVYGIRTTFSGQESEPVQYETQSESGTEESSDSTESYISYDDSGAESSSADDQQDTQTDAQSTESETVEEVAQ